MRAQYEYFMRVGKKQEANRIKERVEYDLEMIRELGYCSGIENYSRFFDRRKPGTRPFCLLDYFPKDFLCIIDESHQTMSATPAEYELEKTGGVVVEQVVRPTGLLDPPIEVRPSHHQIDDLLHEIDLRIASGDRVLITTLTKRMAEEMNQYLAKRNIKAKYIHSDVDTLERVEILRDLRLGVIDVLVGVNLLREGLDLPEVSLVAILDADKEGFLRNEKSLTQTAGRAARNVNGLVIFYADKMTMSMQRTIDETSRRRAKQVTYNEIHNITPTTVSKSKEQVFAQTSVLDIKGYDPSNAVQQNNTERQTFAEQVVYTTIPQIEKAIKLAKKEMEAASKDMDFIEAARLRDEMFRLQKISEEMK
jgi:excinuclease ABC subunit B